MTEEEAKTQRCIGPENVGKQIGELRFCNGSVCKMAWRWIDAGIEWSGTYTNQPAPAGGDWNVQIERGDRYGRWVRPKPRLDGYCGLAGKP